MFGCAVDPSDSCADGGLNRTWDLCNVVDVYLVTDRSSSTASTGSLYVTLYGEDLVVLKTTELSSEILRKKISKVSLPLDNPAAVRTIKIEAAARVSLRIFEVQTIVNDLPPTIFAPPTPGQISFVGNEDIASTGIVSLWFVPVKQFLNGAALSQCLFDSVGRCGYHADLQRSSGLLFLTEEGNELIVAAKSTFTPSSRRLSEAKSHPELVPPSLSSFPTVTDRLRTATSSGYLGVTLLSDDMVTVLVDEPVEVRINDVLEEIKRAREEDEYFYLVSVEVRWSTTSAFEYTRMSGASSREQVDEEKSVTRWRIHRRNALMRIFITPKFVGKSDFIVLVDVKVEEEVKQYSKKFFVTVKNDLQLQSSDLKNTEDTEAIAGVDAQKSRRLENLDTSAMVVELPPLVVDLQAEDPFRLLASDLFSSVAGTSVPFCETSFTIFSLVNIIATLETLSTGVQNVAAIHNPVVRHLCHETLTVKLLPNVKSVRGQIRVVTMDADDAVLAVAIIPFSWSVIPRVELSIPSQLLLGAHNILAGELLELILNYSEDFTNASVGIMIANCSSFSILPVGSANSTSEDCSFLLKDAGSSASFSGVTITESQDRAARVGVEVTISQLMHGVDSTTWTLSESSLVSYNLHFCELMETNGGPLVMRKGTKTDIILSSLALTVLGHSLLDSQLLRSISFVLDNVLLPKVGSFFVDDTPAHHVESFNSTASFITLNADNGARYSFTPYQYGTFLVDVIVEWKSAENTDSGCFFAQHFVVSVLPSFSQPLFAAPYSFSRKVLQGSTAQITIPTMATTNPEIEYISLAVAVNTTDNNIIIKRDGIQYYPLTDDQRYFFLIQRDDAMDSAKRGILSITPNSSFSGILQFAISVSAIGFIDDAIPFQELGVESSTIREVEIEWIPDDEPLEKPVPAGEAIYRSLSTKLQGNATLSFGYQMSSDFSSIKTDVVLNSTEIRQLWSSDSVAVTPGAWKHVEAFIDLSYATSAEIIFRGVVSVDNAVYLKSISIRDYTQESKVGEIEFVRATGGMIYIEVSTAKSIPDPVLLRAHVKEAGSAESTALRFAGDGLQYRGCAAITAMYPCTDSSGISFTSLSQCRTLCTAVETQLRFTPESIVRSAQMISLSINEAFTVEFWVYLEHLSPSSSDQQLLLLHGSQEGSLSVTLNSYLLISRCQNQLRIPHGLPLETWTHLAIVFGADNEVTVLMNGVEMADGRLSKENCDVPAYAYLQLGRDTMNIRPETSVLQGAMDEIRIWKTARESADVYASYETNIVHSDMILVFHFNSVHKTNWYSSGAEGSANNVDFIVQNVRARNSRQIHNFGISGDGKCYYTLSEFTTDEGLDGYICDKNCGDGSGRTCGSNITDNVTSVYGKGPIGVGGLSSLTGYEISVEFVTDESEEYKITNPLIASTSNVTVPGKVDYINAVELSDQQLEIYWSPVDDDGGSEILKYLVFLNGIQVAGTTDGDTFSVALSIAQIPRNCNVTVQAVNAVGAGPQSNLLALVNAYSDPAPQEPQCSSASSRSGGSVELALDAMTRRTVEELSWILVIEQREASLTSFTTSFYRLNGSVATVFKLRHNTVYIFRLGIISTTGLKSGFSVPISVRTGNRASPSKTSLPSVAAVTGGAIKLELEEPLDTGGLPIAQYNVFFLRDGAYEKLTSIVASRTSENTTITVTRDANGNPLLPLTTYTFKVLALQANMGCDTLTGDDLESDAVSATTDVAAIPAPPSRPVLLLGSKCFALVTVAPPDDFGGAYVTGMTIGIFLSTGALHESFSVTLFPGEITIRNLLAYSSYAVKAALNTTIGDSGFGEALVFTTKDPSPPGKLTLLEITDLGSSSLIVRWKGPQDTGGGAISGYLLYQRAITATGTQDLIYNGSTDASKTSFLVGGLLASTKYVFAAIPVNQYGLAGMDDDHLVYATTFGQEVPFPPTDIKDSKVDAGYVELSFSEPFYTGALATVNDKGSSSYSSSIVVTTGEARRPGFPQLELISASGGSISLKWSLPEDTGGAPIVRMSLSVDGDELFDTDSALNYTHCGSLQKSTDYMYAIEIENAAGLTNRATSSFMTTTATPPGPVKLSEPFVDMQSITVPVTLSCDDGGISDGLKLSYRVFKASDSSATTAGSVSCCIVTINGLLAATDYRVEVRAENSVLKGDWTAVNFTTLSGIPSSPNTSLLFATSTALELALIPPTQGGGGSLSIEVEVASDASNSVVFQNTLDCSLVEQEYECPDTLSVSGLTAEQDDFTYVVAVRATGSHGSSTWERQTYDVDNGKAGKIGFLDSFYRGTEGEDIEVKIARVYGTTTLDENHFLITADEIVPTWTCSLTASGATCLADSQGDNRGYINFGIGEYLKTITLTTFDDAQYEAAAVSLNVTLVSATSSSLSNTHGGALSIRVLAPVDCGGSVLMHYVVNIARHTGGALAYRQYELGTVDSSSYDSNIANVSIYGLLSNSEYFVTVSVGNAQGWSRISDEQIYKTTRPTPVSGMAAPTVALEDPGELTIQWNTPLDSGGLSIVGYRIQSRRKFGNGSWSYPEIAYDAVNAKGKSEATTLSTTTRAATIPDKMLLPRLVSVTGGRLQFEVLPPPNFGGSDIVDYSFYANRTLNDVVRNSKTGYDLVGLSALTFYSVAVSATNAVGEGEQSDALIVTTDSVTMPGQVWGLIMTSKTYEAIEVEWMMPYDTGGDATAVQFEAEINSSTSDGNMISSATSSVVLSNLEPATLYTIQVRAFNLIGEGPWSTSLSVTTDPVSSGVINFEKDAVDVSEDGGSVTLTLVRTMGGFMPATCTFTTVDGTAIAGDHYVQTSGQVKFNRGVNSQQISIPIIDNDVIDDPEKYFSVSIEEYNNESGTIGEISSVIVTITDDGDAGVVEFGQERYTVSESVSTLTVTIVRTKKFSGNGTFTIKPVDTAEGAVEGVDYKIPIKSIGFSEQETQASCNITIINDSTYQERKLLKLKLDVVSGKVAIDDPTAFLTIEILDDGDTSPPGLPTSVQVNAVSGGMVNVSWIAPEYLGAKNPGELSYFVHVVEAQSGSTREESIKASSLLFPQLKSRTAYEFSIAAKNAFFLGEYTVSVPTLMKEPTPPSSPIGVQVLSQTGGMVTLSWLPPFDSGGLDISRYRVNVSINIDNKPFGTYLTNGSAISIGKLEPVTSYSATVEAINKNELVGEASATISFTTTGVSMPGKPTSVVIAKATGGALLVEMALPLDIGGAPVLYFTLFMTSAQYPPVFRQVYQGSAPSFYATRLAFSTTYKLQYRVTTKVGTSELSDVFTAATTFLTPPDEAQNLAAVSRTGGSVTLSWTQPVDFGGTDITAYDVAFFLGYEIKAQFRQRVSGVSVNTTSVTAKVVGLQANSTYGFSVSGANDVSVCEDPSTIRSRTILYSSTDTAVSLPDTPRGLTVALATSGTQTMQWTSSDDAGGDSFVAYLLYSDTGAILYNETIGEGARSDAMKVVMGPATLPSVPNNLRVVLRTAFSVFFQWDKSDDTGGDDVVYEIAFSNLNTSETGQAETNTTTVEIPKLIPGNDYMFRVRARNSAGRSEWTPDLSAETDVTQRGVITYNLVSPTVFENATRVTVQLLRVNGSSSTITCKYSTTSGTAVYGRDYTLPPEAEHTFTFVGEVVVKSFDVQIINNDVYEPIPRTIGLTLTDTTPDRSDPFPPTPILITIMDDGDAGMISFVATEVTVLENARILSLPLQREYGKSTAVSAQIVVYTGWTSTTQPDIGFRLPSTSVDFVDGQTSSSASIVIKDNDVYDFPYLYFYLTLEIQVGAAKVGANSVIKVVVQDDGDRSVPGILKAPTLDKATGGMLRLKWEPPANVGGQNVWISAYNVSIRAAKSAKWIVTPTNATMLPFGGLNVLTEYAFTISAINSIGRGADSPSVAFSTTNLTVPGPPEQIALLNRTGGLLTVSITAPNDAGGAPVTGYLLYLSEQGGDYKMAYNGTGYQSSIVPVSVSKPNTAYTIRAQAINVVAAGDMSESFAFESGQLSRPGPPRLPVKFSSQTGGAIKLNLLPPLDTGGHENISYMIYYREQGLGERFRLAYYVTEDLKITIFRLGADTTYDVVAISHLEDSANVLTWGKISVSDSRITLSDNVTTDIVNSGYFEFGGYLFEVDTTQAQSNNTITYSASLSTDVGAIATTNLQNGDEYDVYVRGAFSDVANYTTAAPTRPGMPPISDLDYATGGALHVRISWPDDTGGIPITGYEFYINNKTVEGTLYHYISNGDLELQVTVEIGGLTPESNYSFYYIPLNDASACPGVDEGRPVQVVYTTEVASKPMPIQLIRSTSATGGGIHVEVKPPNDKGSDQDLTYQIYMSPSRTTPVWTRMYNDKGSSYWQTKLQKATEYLFMASCMNAVGYSSNSSIFSLSTTLISAPGPPGDLTLKNATGGMIQFSWKSPDDDGGSSITYYSIHAQDTSGNPELVLETLLPEISFGGLLANRVYEFKVYAGNSLGTGSDASVKRYSTTLPTPPSLPGDPIVLQSSGGSATLAIKVPTDTGGVNIDDLVCTVYGNGFKVPADAVRRLQDNPIPASKTRRLMERRLAADDGAFIYLQAGGLLPSTAYAFTIQVSNNVGVSDTTNGIVTATSVATVPGAPASPTEISATGGAITLSWTDPVDTGGVPLTSYRLSMTRLGEEVGSCEGMIRSCTIGDLLSISVYTVTLVAYNPVGVSLPSEIATFTTETTSLPLAPQDVHVAELSNTSVTIHWDPCIDFGGGYVDTYRLNIAQISSPSVTFSNTTPVDEPILTIQDLIPQTEYTATVRAVTGAGEPGEASKIIFFRTPLSAHQPSPPLVGCHSRKVANVFWEAEDDAVNYRLFRDGELYIDNGEDITYEDEIVVGTTYIYQVQVIRFDGSISALSEATTFAALAPMTSGFDCVGNKGHIHWHDYKNLDHETWTITPQSQAGIMITFSMFWLECDHDSLTISVTKGGVTKQLWKGGCHRKGDFVVSTGPGIDSVTLYFSSDGSVAYDGMALHYEAVDASDAVEFVSAPCPLSSNGFCSLNGACRKGSCSCFSGYVGESCTNAVICPEDLTTCTATTCDPVCLQSQNDVIVVSENGDDTQGTGERMDTCTSGTDPKAVKSLRRALELATSGKTILLYPGVYSGVDNCGVTVSTASLLIRGLRGPIATTIDCKNLLRGLIITSNAGPNRLEGFTLKNALASTDGGAIRVSDTAIRMKNIVITNGISRQNGGAIYAYHSQLTLTNVELTDCAAAKGGAVFLDNSDLTLDHSTIKLCSAGEGGGMYAQNTVSVSGDKDSKIWQNTASINGGGLCVAGTFTGTTLNLLENTALMGAGLTGTSGSSTLSDVSIAGNRATSDGGGIALLNTANLVLQNSPIQTNHADRNGGGVFIVSNGSFENRLTSEIFNCTADIGGGFYTGDWARPTVKNLRVVSSSAIESGGCAAFSRSSATLSSPDFEKCDAPIGGGVNQAEESGGGLMLLEATVYHSNVEISNNVAPTAGGVCLNSVLQPTNLLSCDDAATQRSRVEANVIDPKGGNGANVVMNCTSNCTLSGSVISGANVQFGQGAGVFVLGRGIAVISNSLIANNSAAKGGGIAVSDAEKTVLENVAVVGNIASDRGGGLWAESSAFFPEVDLLSCVFYNNSAKTSGGAISLYGVYLYSSVLLVVENRAGNSESGMGGGLFSDKRVNPDTSSSVMADTWLFLSNDAPVGGSLAGVTASEISLLDANITRDTDRFFTDTWPDFFEDLVGFKYVASHAQNKIDAQKGDLIYLSDRDSILKLLKSFATQGSADAGGGIYINANAFFFSQDSEISSNTANERGGSVCLSNSAQAYFTSVKVIFSDSKTSGGGIYVESSSKLYAVNSDISDNFADDSGGGIFIDTGDKNAVTLNGSFVDRNLAHGEGCGIFVGREAILAGYKTQFWGNGGVITSGKNEGGGAISSIDGIVKLTSCTLVNNTALVGGAIHFDRGGSAAIMSSVFKGNTADQNGGAIATTVKAKVTIALQTSFESNVAHFGGAMAVSGTSTITLTSVHFRTNQASEDGGALFITDQATVTMKAGELAGNSAVLGGALYSDGQSATSISDAKFIKNVAFTRGGALYYQSIDNATITGITCKENTAPSGGCMFWVSKDEDLTPVHPCTSCTMEFNAVYDIATNTRDVHVMWWPDNMTSGVPILEPPDEESIEVIKPRNASLEKTMHVWPRLKAVDLYGQVEVLDNQTECMVSDGLCSEQTERLLFEPRTIVRSTVGVISYRGASFTAANRTPEEGIYTTDISCTLPGSEPRFFVQNMKLLPCLPGYSVNQGVCERCPKNMYSLDGLKCFYCPSGAKCNMTVRRATDTIAEELGTVSPRTEEGFYLFSAPATKQKSSCNKPSQWKNEDPCKKLALENPRKNLSDVIYECSNLNDFNVYWSADRLFSCLSGKIFYTCDVEGACQADVSVQMLALTSTVSTVSCTSGYDLAICSVCADGFKRARDNSCMPCNEANAEVRASIKWQNFVIPVLLVLALIGGVFAVRFYLRDLTEIGLLAKAEADRRLKAPDSKKGGNMALRAGAKYRRQSMAVVGRVDQTKNKLSAFFKKYQNRNAKMVFGVDVSPPPRTFPVNPSKFKIFIGFFQIFGNFQNSFVVKWSSNVQDVMNISQKFNLDLVAIAGIDCVVTKNFYFDFTVTVSLVVLALTVITAYFYAGTRSYRSKLQLIPRNCLRCGLPVLESEVIKNDDESFNPLRLLRSWWRTYNFYKHSGSSSPVEAAKSGPENETTAALSTIRETRALKRKFGMSQVRTPYLGLFRSVHAKCPTKRHLLSGAMLDRTIRSNLRVWQARVKLRMNYLTYRNKCLKLYCWMALFLYPSVSKTILTIYNCQEVGDVFYLVVDRRLVCYNGQWAVFGMIATIGVIVWVVGIPFFFGLLIWLAQDRGVAARIKLLRKPQMRVQRQKWLKEVEEQQIADGRFVRDMDNVEVQDEELTKYMKRKNLTDSTVQARLGFIYAEYTHDYWWFEVVDLSRKLFLSGVIVFVENGSVEQVLLALAVCLTTMWFLLYFQPYDGYSDNLIASITQLQLFFTLWLGVMIRLNDLNIESLINVQFLSFLLVGTCIAVTIFGISMIIGEGLAESRRISTETTAQRKKQVQEEARKRWFKAYNYAAYEAQMLRYGASCPKSRRKMWVSR
ncbi:hypothetical protein PC115_g3107 [Phytophthora cactorum]|uniref:Fibronectin type-III domain-containing protein n=1 Tax=Phytophthora cactorum TaxID=29920 RepID=A0A8T1DI78_9STRA|nr:hypothetical protein PC115_g3107 [Phytophthora cactorum]